MLSWKVNAGVRLYAVMRVVLRRAPWYAAIALVIAIVPGCRTPKVMLPALGPGMIQDIPTATIPDAYDPGALPDRGLLAFVREQKDGEQWIYLQQGTKAKKLCPGISPRFSTKGLFFLSSSTGFQWRVMLIPWGGQPRALGVKGRMDELSVSPDGRRLLLPYLDRQGGEYLFDVETRRLRRIRPSPPHNMFNVSWTSAHTVVFDSHPAGPPGNIYTMRIDAAGNASKPRLLVRNARSPAVSPNGRLLAYVGHMDTGNHPLAALTVVRRDTGELVLRKKPSVRYFPPAYFRRPITWISDAKLAAVYCPNKEDHEIKVYRVPSSPSR